jgi:hypothetical protein
MKNHFKFLRNRYSNVFARYDIELGCVLVCCAVFWFFNGVVV